MIQLSLAPVMPHGPVRPALLASGSASSFALALGALAAPRAVAPAPADESEALLPGRQTLARAGKDLPELSTIADGRDSDEEQDAPEGADIAFAWFAVAPVAQPVPAAPGVAAAAPPVELEAGTGAPRSAPALVDLPAATPLPDPAGAEHAAPDAPVAEAGVEHLVATLPTPDPAGPTERAEALPNLTGDLPDLPVPDAPAPVRPIAGAGANLPVAGLSPMPARPVPMAESEQPVQQAEAAPRAIEPEIQSAERASAQVRLSPIGRSSGQAPTTQPLRAAAPSPPAPPMTPINPAIVAIMARAPAAPAPLHRPLAEEAAALALLPPASDATQPHAVSTAADVQQAALDTRRQEWMGKMVEHIETLRDAAPVRETRISLAPEALGNVEVSIRREGDRVHVHFTTETAAARQLIADAQPRLAELAEARGLKLGQTSFESGTAGQSPNRDSRSNPAPQRSRAPLPANSESAVGSADDERIA